MRNKFIHGLTFLAVAGWIIGACATQPLPSDESGAIDKMVLRADLPEDTESKTSLGIVDGKYVVLWKTGDKISVNGLLSNEVASSDNGKKGVEFTINGSPTAPYNVLYPGTTSSNVIVLPETQNHVAGSFDGAAAASFGVAVEGAGGNFSVQLTPFCGLLRFALKGSATLTKIEINSLGSEKLRGNFTISNFTTGAFSGGTAGTLTYNCPVTLTGSDTYFYVAIPAQTYASGIEALVYQSDGAFMRLKFWGTGRTLGNRDLIEFESKDYAAGRTENLFEINSLSAENGGAPSLTPPTITVATFNTMRMDDTDRPTAAVTPSESDAKKGALNRPDNAIGKSNTDMHAALGLAIYNTAADVIGFQEIGPAMYQTGQTYSIQDWASAQGASSYTWKLEFPASSNYHYCNGFAYKSSVLTLNNSGKAWLKAESDSYSTSSSSGSGDPNRTVVWALFTHNLSGKQFYFFITQLPPANQNGGDGTSTNNMAGGVNAFAASKGTSLPKILAGDLNCSGSTVATAYSTLTSYWTDAWEHMYEVHETADDLADWYYYKNKGTQSGTGTSYQYSMAQFTKGHDDRRLDHIMVRNGSSGSAIVQSYRTVRNKYTVHSNGDDGVANTDDDYDVDCAPSDHLPIVCEITLE